MRRFLLMRIDAHQMRIDAHEPNCTLGHAQILEQIPKKSPIFFKWDYYDEIPCPETRFDTNFTQISGPN